MSRLLTITALLLSMCGLAAAQRSPALVEQSLLLQTNAQRATHGLRALLPDEALARAARQHASEMAELSYLAHESPRPEHRTLGLRLNLAGAIVQGVGENLALLSGVDDLATAAVEGWMDSPGHRRNLLGDFTHVGFGFATSPGGATYVVQVLGLKTVDIASVEVHRSLEQVHVLDIGFTLSSPREVAFWLGEDVQVPGLFGPGAHQFRAEVSELALLHVNSATRPSGSADVDPYISAHSGWFDPAAGTWTPVSSSSTETLRIDSVRSGSMARETLIVTVRFAGAPAARVAAWLAGEQLRDVDWNGQVLTLKVPIDAAGRDLQVGIEENPGAGVYSIVLNLEVAAGPGGTPVLSVRNPGS